MLVVGATGVVNSLSQQIANHWMRTELAEMIAPWRNVKPPSYVVPVQTAINVALARFPGMTVATVAMPGTMFAGPHHYDVFLAGNEPLTAKVITPVLINAEDGAFSDSRSLPWYAKALFLSKPLHFGDYGGMPLKIIWALLDIMTLLCWCPEFISGLYEDHRLHR